jgi:hypothetical protein
MRCGIRNLLGKKSDKPGQAVAPAAEEEDAINDPLGDTAMGLDVWVPGVDPIVEYVSFIS